MGYREVWKDFNGSIRKGSHVHHIIPRCEGGTDTIGNLIELHPDDHYLIHKMRGDRWSGAVLVMRNGHSDETRRKMSESRIGNQNSKGVVHTEEMNRRQSEIKKKMYAEGWIHPRINPTKHHWINKYGVEIVATSYYMHKTFSGCFSRLVRGVRLSNKGWRLVKRPKDLIGK